MQHYALFRLHKWKCLGVVIPYPTRCCNSIITLSWWHKKLPPCGRHLMPTCEFERCKDRQKSRNLQGFREKFNINRAFFFSECLLLK